jgi:hypothetical protein
MARGWESKAVESQIEAAEERASRAKQLRISLEEVALERERESIELSRARVLQDLADSSNPKYRIILERSLAFLDDKLSKLPPRPGIGPHTSS